MISNGETKAKRSPVVVQIIIGIGFGLLLFTILGAIKFFQIREAMANGAKMGPPPQAVTTTKVVESDWHSEVVTPARVEAKNGALIKAESSGRIENIFFEDGTEVKKGDLLLELDSAVEKAEYHAAQAQSELAKKTFQRQEKLFNLKAISQEEFDNANLNYLALESTAKALKSRLDKKVLKAPFDGKIGVRRVNIGQYVMEGDPLFELQDDSELYLTFSVGEDESARIKINDEVTFVAGSNGLEYPSKVVAIDPNISSITGTKMLKAKFDSHPGKLTIGTFGKAYVKLSEVSRAMIIPETSIQHAPYGDSIFVVEQVKNEMGETSSVAMPKFIKIFDRRGDFVAIKDGLLDGAEIVTSGTFKLQKGTKLIINNSSPEKVELQPNPENS